MDIIAVLFAIVFGIISIFSNQAENKKQKSKPIARPTPTPSGRTFHEEVEPMIEVEPQIEPIKTELNKLYEDKLENLSQTQKSYNISSQLKSKGPKSNQTNKDQAIEISVKNQLTKKRIVESLIMNEVLGSPRAHKPFQYNNKQKIK